MPAKKKRPVKVGRPVAKRSSQEASVAEEAAEQDQQEEITFTSTSISTTHSHCCEEKEEVPGPVRRTRDGVGDWLKENPMLYTKTMKEYKDMTKKIHLWNSKAAELDVESGSMLKT